MKKSKKTATIRQLGRKFNMSRDTVSKLLEPLPFEIGPGKAHLYDSVEAEKILTNSSHVTAEMKRLRLAKLQAEVSLVEQRANDYNKSHVTVDACLYMLETFSKCVYGEMRQIFPNYHDEFLAECRIESAAIRAMEDMDYPEDMVRERGEELHKKQGNFAIDLAAGRVPTFWAAPGTTWDFEKGYRVYAEDKKNDAILAPSAAAETDGETALS